jgi:hypothetical protein
MKRLMSTINGDYKMTNLTNKDITGNNYFDYPALSASGINQFLSDDEGPYVYWKHSPFNNERIKKEPTDDMLIGTVAHCLLLETDEIFQDAFAIMPEGMRRDNRVKAWLDFKDDATIHNKIIITHKIYEEAVRLVTPLRKHKGVMVLLSDGRSEVPIIWERDGIKCKMKADFIRNGGTAIFDYKTTRTTTPTAYFKSMASMGYHRAVAWYIDGIKSATGEEPELFAHIVQNKEYPELIGFPKFPQHMIEAGRAENNYAIEQIKRRLESNQWNPWGEGFMDADFPEYYRLKGAHQLLLSNFF